LLKTTFFEKEFGKAKFSMNDSVYFVLKVGNRSVEFDPRKNEESEAIPIEPNTIESISVLKGEEAKNKYGEGAKHGVVIITFKDFDMISKELQKKFSDPSKK
jgi:hypothetical protein